MEFVDILCPGDVTVLEGALASGARVRADEPLAAGLSAPFAGEVLHWLTHAPQVGQPLLRVRPEAGPVSQGVLSANLVWVELEAQPEGWEFSSWLGDQAYHRGRIAVAGAEQAAQLMRAGGSRFPELQWRIAETAWTRLRGSRRLRVVHKNQAISGASYYVNFMLEIGPAQHDWWVLQGPQLDGHERTYLEEAWPSLVEGFRQALALRGVLSASARVCEFHFHPVDFRLKRFQEAMLRAVCDSVESLGCQDDNTVCD